MSVINLSQKFKFSKQVDLETLIDFLKQELNATCKYQVESESEDRLVISGTVKEKLFTKVVKFNAAIEIRVEDEKAKISVQGSSSPNWIFWILMLFGFVTLGTFFAGIGLFFYQREKPAATIASILKALDTQYGAL